MQYQDMTKKEMQREYHRLCQRYQEYEQQGLQLDPFPRKACAGAAGTFAAHAG